MLDHVRFSHRKERPYACSKCIERYSSKRYLTAHVNRGHEKKEPELQCDWPECHDKFFTNAQRKIHYRGAHENAAVYLCQHCPWGWQSAGSFDIHLLGHDPKKDYRLRCPECSWGCNESPQFARHVQFCEYASAQSKNPRLHVRAEVADQSLSTDNDAREHPAKHPTTTTAQDKTDGMTDITQSPTSPAATSTHATTERTTSTDNTSKHDKQQEHMLHAESTSTAGIQSGWPPRPIWCVVPVVVAILAAARK